MKPKTPKTAGCFKIFCKTQAIKYMLGESLVSFAPDNPEMVFSAERIDLTKALINYIYAARNFFTDYQPCQNAAYFRNFQLYGFIVMAKILILSHGVVNILPKWVSVPLFPSLIVCYHKFLATRQVVTCNFSMWNFAFLWTLLFQFPCLDITGKNLVCVSLITMVIIFLEVIYVGCQFAIDVFIVLTTLWFLVKSFLNNKFNVTFTIFACAIFYFHQSRGPQVPEVFYIFVFLMLMGIYGGYITSRENTSDMLFYFSTVFGITLLLTYNVMQYGFTGIERSKAAQELPFKRLPAYEQQSFVEVKAVKDPFEDDPPYSEAFQKSLESGPLPLDYEFIMLETANAMYAPRPRVYKQSFPTKTRKPGKTPVPEVVESEIKSIILSQSANGSTNFSASMQVKYQNNETMPRKLL